MAHHLILGFILIAVGIPLILGLIPPNRWYGFRTPKTLSDEKIWYPANRVSGWSMVAAGAAIIFITEVIGYSSPWVLMAPVGAAVLYSFWRLRHL